jgi:hypothetical protein
LGQIAQAVSEDAFHVLHLSAHGSAAAVELTTEDGDPVRVGAGELIDALRRAGRPVPLIILSACSTASTPGAGLVPADVTPAGGAGASGGAAGGDRSHSDEAEAMAAGLIARGADRVIAMQAPVTDRYATLLARALYRELADHPDHSVAEALALARVDAQDVVSRESRGSGLPWLPEYAVATLLCAGDDPPLVDADAGPEPLSRPAILPTGRGVRELPVGQLIGRRAELRDVTAVLRRTPTALDGHGAVAGVALVGIGGIGKTAVAGRVIARLREDGWAVAVHEGRWNPTAVFAVVADALATSVDAGGVGDAVEALRDTAVSDAYDHGWEPSGSLD